MLSSHTDYSLSSSTLLSPLQPSSVFTSNSSGNPSNVAKLQRDIPFSFLRYLYCFTFAVAPFQPA